MSSTRLDQAEKEVDSRLCGTSYNTLFSPRVYLEFYYGTWEGCSAEGELLPFSLTALFEIFEEMPKDGRLLEIGSGPTIHVVAAASRCFREIVMSDYAEQNLKEVDLWLKKDPSAFNWNSVLEFIGKKEGIPCNSLCHSFSMYL